MNKCIIAVVVLILNVHFCSAGSFPNVLYEKEEVSSNQGSNNRSYRDFSTRLRSNNGSTSPDNGKDEEMGGTTDNPAPVKDGLMVLAFLVFGYGLSEQIRRHRKTVLS